MLDETGVLRFLECPPGPPGIRHLNQLILAYIRKVPWETVFRIIKRSATQDPSQCPRLPEEFWRDAMQCGAGGTCFESNYAFYWLLQKLGYAGYLTVNDMGNQRGCHAAIVLDLNGHKMLTDVAIPLLVALPIHPGRMTRRSTWLHTYTIRPDGADRYQILRTRHPKPNIYTLHDTPVSDSDYRRTIAQDYGEAGLFLDRVILVKIIGERLWRFSSNELPYRMESFGRDGRQETPIHPQRLSGVLAERFSMNESKIETALRLSER